MSRKNNGYNNIRIQPYPSLEEGNSAFPKGLYEIEHERGEAAGGFVLRHKISGARLIERMVSQGRAVYVCAISAPRSAFRELLISQDSSQKISWNAENFGEQPYFTPMIVCTKETKILLNPDFDDVHEDWRNAEITFPRGARLAQSSVWQCRAAGIIGLLSIQANDKLSDGQFHVELNEGTDIRFIADCHPRLHAFLKSKKECKRRLDILTHIVTACFVQLQKWEKEKSDGNKANSLALNTLEKQLEDAGYKQHWGDDAFHPELAATALYPHKIPIEQDADD